MSRNPLPHVPPLPLPAGPTPPGRARRAAARLATRVATRLTPRRLAAGGVAALAVAAALGPARALGAQTVTSDLRVRTHKAPPRPPRLDRPGLVLTPSAPTTPAVSFVRGPGQLPGTPTPERTRRWLALAPLLLVPFLVGSGVDTDGRQRPGPSVTTPPIVPPVVPPGTPPGTPPGGPATPPTIVTPEPATGWLVGLGIALALGLGFRRRWRGGHPVGGRAVRR